LARTGPQLRFGEFVTLTALIISLVALSIDVMLPALQQIGGELGAPRANDAQLVITALFVGLALGQVFFGPLSDSVGRKPAIYAGLLLFIIGCLMSILATDFTVMLAGRVLQGLGAAGPRSVTVALVRDQYEGRAMARVMSLVMAVFIMVPALAPGIGQIILAIAHWRAIFGFMLAVAAVSLVWFALRQPETLAPERRARFSLGRILLAVRETCTSRVAFGYTLSSGLIFGAFVGYLNTAQQIFQIQYGLGALFPLYFGALALAIGGASLVNARLVLRHGMRRISAWALGLLTGLSLAFLVLAYTMAGAPPLWGLMAYMSATFFCIGMLFANFNALAMEPLGHIAGVGAAVIGSLTTLISLILGTAIGQAYDGTVLPLIAGFALLGLAAIAVMRWIERGKGLEET
jgi:DHA1 family bicyclomycin/chloramphenicol resistance-like MFS transporter